MDREGLHMSVQHQSSTRRSVIWFAAIVLCLWLGTCVGSWAQSTQGVSPLFYDDFGNPQSGWRVGAGRDAQGRLYKLSYQDGEYAFGLLADYANCWAWAPIAATLPASFRLQVSVRVVSGTADFGFAVGRGDQDHYHFGVAVGGGYYVYRVTSGEVSSLLVGTGSPVLAGAVHHLELVLQGRDATFSIDGNTLLNFQLPASNAPYKVGLEAGSSRGKVEVRFDEFSVTAM